VICRRRCDNDPSHPRVPARSLVQLRVKPESWIQQVWQAGKRILRYFSMLGAAPKIGRLFGPQDFALGLLQWS